jgi:hypothetical protein
MLDSVQVAIDSLVLLGFLSLSFKNDSKKSATKVISQGNAKLLNLIHIVQQMHRISLAEVQPAMNTRVDHQLEL